MISCLQWKECPCNQYSLSLIGLGPKGLWTTFASRAGRKCCCSICTYGAGLCCDNNMLGCDELLATLSELFKMSGAGLQACAFTMANPWLDNRCCDDSTITIQQGKMCCSAAQVAKQQCQNCKHVLLQIKVHNSVGPSSSYAKCRVAQCTKSLGECISETTVSKAGACTIWQHPVIPGQRSNPCSPVSCPSWSRSGRQRPA